MGFPCGAAECWNPASGVPITSRSRLCPTSCCRATSRPAHATGSSDVIRPWVEVTPEGTIVVGDKIGFGYDLDVEYLAQVRVKQETLKAS